MVRSLILDMDSVEWSTLCVLRRRARASFTIWSDAFKGTELALLHGPSTLADVRAHLSALLASDTRLLRYGFCGTKKINSPPHVLDILWQGSPSSNVHSTRALGLQPSGGFILRA